MTYNRVLSFSLAFTLVFMSAGCSGGSPDSSSGDANTSPAPPVATAPSSNDSGDSTAPDPDSSPAPIPPETAQPAPDPDAPVLAEVSLYKLYEQSVTNGGHYTNKFTDVSLDVEYKSPSGRTVQFRGFYDGDGAGGQHGDVWKMRFMPDEAGTWTYRYTWSDGTEGGSGAFKAVAQGAGRGILRAYRHNPHWFAYNGEDPVFLKSYHVGQAGFTGVPLEWAVRNVYSKLASRGYNHVMMKVLPIAWTNERPTDSPRDHISKPLWNSTPRVQNLDVWQRFEEHMAWLNDHNMHVYFFMGFDPKSSGPATQFFASQRWTDMSAADQAHYVRYVTARLAPFANIAGWNYTWETDGTTGEQRLMDLLARYDPWQHLATYHDEAPWRNFYDNPRYTYAAIENHEYFGNNWGARALDSASHYQSTIDAYRGKPVYMAEGNGLWRACWAREQAGRTIPRAAWAVTLAGGSFNWQDTPDCFSGPISDMFAWPAGNPMVNRVDTLYKVMTGDVEFHKMKPHNEVLGDCWSSFNRLGAVPTSPCFALAELGQQYVVYKENGGAFSVSLAAGVYDATWIDTRTGARQPASGGTVNGGARIHFIAPSSSTDWVLVLKLKS